MMFHDQMGRTVTLPSRPQKIISLVPSQTELLYDLGLDEEVAGITKFCVHPDSWFRTKTRIGGTKNLNIDLIRQIQPDLIIGNKEENDKGQVEILMREFPVWMSDVNHLDDALTMISALGEIIHTNERASEMVRNIKEAFTGLEKEIKQYQHGQPIAATYFIWRKPWMAAGSQTFIHDMMARCGLSNGFADIGRYPEISLEQLSERNCGTILLSSEPYPFKEKHAEEIRQQLPGVHILLVDGEMFSWYGSRLLLAPAYFSRIAKQIHGRD